METGGIRGKVDVIAIMGRKAKAAIKVPFSAGIYYGG